jgi:lipopolysaccharide/colanic/teichoic acid biosynthesis glycosyltransferase
LIEEFIFTFTSTIKKNMYLNYVKSFFDFMAAFIGLIILSPLIIVITILLFFLNNGKPFYFQNRPGHKEKIFRIIKFKTMNDKKNEAGELLPDFERTTLVGKFIRKTSIDEIPQLINVFLGHMSLVGPRPLLPEYLPLYNENQKRRHDVKPGITGWAQINGRNSILWTKKFEHDVWYVDNATILLDMKILLLTVKKVLIPQGINATEKYTMEEFNGKN